MEDASSDTAQTIALTAELARDLQAAMAGNLPEKPAAGGDANYSTPRFGSVYFGPLKWFAGGEPHYGMVTGGLRSHRQLPPEVPFSPITTKEKTGRNKQKTVLLPPGTLPSRVSHGFNLMKPSRILLFITIPISMRRMRELMADDRMHFVQRLKDSFLEEARAILAGQ